MVISSAPEPVGLPLRFERHPAFARLGSSNPAHVGLVLLDHDPGFPRAPWAPGIARRVWSHPRPRRPELVPRHTFVAPAAPGTPPAFSFRVTRGALMEGGPAVTEHIVFASEEEARAAFDRQIFGLERRGYLAGMHDPALLEALVAANAVSAEAATTEKAAHAYAAWLLERSDPRGSLMQAMLLNEGDAAIERLLVAHSVLLRPLWWARDTASVEWHLGFVRRVRFDALRKPADLHRMFRHPSMALLRELEVYDATRYEGQTFPPNARPLREGGHIQGFRRALAIRPRGLTRIVLRGNPYLEMLEAEIDGLTVV